MESPKQVLFIVRGTHTSLDEHPSSLPSDSEDGLDAALRDVVNPKQDHLLDLGHGPAVP